MKILPIEGQPDLVRDPRTGMFVNINKDKIRQELLKRERAKQEREEMNQLKSDVEQIKQMLQKLLENGSNG